MNQISGKQHVAKPVAVQANPSDGPLSKPEQESLKRIQAQAERRIKLGMELLQAAQTHTDRQQDIARQFKQQQQRLRDEVQNDIASSLQTYDQWMAKFDERFTAKLRLLEQRLDAMQGKWVATEHRIAAVLERTQELLDQIRSLSPPQEAGHQPSAPVPSQPPVPRSNKPPSPTQPTPAPDEPDTTQPNTVYRQALEQLMEDPSHTRDD